MTEKARQFLTDVANDKKLQEKVDFVMDLARDDYMGWLEHFVRVINIVKEDGYDLSAADFVPAPEEIDKSEFATLTKGSCDCSGAGSGYGDTVVPGVEYYCTCTGPGSGGGSNSAVDIGMCMCYQNGFGR